MIDFREITARVSIRDILADVGYKPQRDRMACPIHDGKNPTAFSFADHTFICFSCGAKGGLLALAENLYECSKQEAMKNLCRLAGLSYERPNRSDDVATTKPNPWPPLIHDPFLDNEDYSKAKARLICLDSQRAILDTTLKTIKIDLRQGDIPLDDFYVLEQHCVYQLEELDPYLIEAKYEFNRIRKGLRSVQDS